MKYSLIRHIMNRATELEKEGQKIFHLEIGDPDFATPEPIIQSTVAYLEAGYTHYGPDEGVEELREEIRKKIKEYNGINLESIDSILITAGASEGIFDAILGITSPGEEVLLLEPAFGNYYHVSICAGLTPVVVPLNLNQRSTIDFAKLEEALTPKTRLILFNNPHNPTGTVFTREEIIKLAQFVKEHDLIIITDEVYEYLAYEGDKPLSIGSLEGMRERCILVNSFSKTYAMTGWRLGYVIAPQREMERIRKVHQYVVTCSPTFTQLGLAKAFHECNQALEDMRRELNQRRLFIISELDTIRGIQYIKPEGGFYVFINIEKSGMTSFEFASRLLEEYQVAVVPGVAFGQSGEGYIRIAYARSQEELVSGMKALTKGLLSFC